LESEGFLLQEQDMNNYEEKTSEIVDDVKHYIKIKRNIFLRNCSIILYVGEQQKKN